MKTEIEEIIGRHFREVKVILNKNSLISSKIDIENSFLTSTLSDGTRFK